MAVWRETIKASLLETIRQCRWEQNTRWKIICPVRNDGAPGRVVYHRGSATEAVSQAMSTPGFHFGRESDPPETDPMKMVIGNDVWGEVVRCEADEWIDHLESRILSIEYGLYEAENEIESLDERLSEVEEAMDEE